MSLFNLIEAHCYFKTSESRDLIKNLCDQKPVSVTHPVLSERSQLLIDMAADEVYSEEPNWSPVIDHMVRHIQLLTAERQDLYVI